MCRGGSHTSVGGGTHVEKGHIYMHTYVHMSDVK